MTRSAQSDEFRQAAKTALAAAMALARQADAYEQTASDYAELARRAAAVAESAKVTAQAARKAVAEADLWAAQVTGRFCDDEAADAP